MDEQNQCVTNQVIDLYDKMRTRQLMKSATRTSSFRHTKVKVPEISRLGLMKEVLPISTSTHPRSAFYGNFTTTPFRKERYNSFSRIHIGSTSFKADTASGKWFEGENPITSDE